MARARKTQKDIGGLNTSHKFVCNYDSCYKAFSRKDHLKRHKLNHDNSAHFYVCEECGMTFKRHDVKKAHYKRHLKWKEREKLALQSLEESTGQAWIRPGDPLINISDNFFFGEGENMEVTSLDELADFLNRPDLNFEPSLNSTLDDLFESDLDNIPTFVTNATLITQDIIREMVKTIPNLEHLRDFPHHLEICLNVYWDIFHVQYPIIHKPSFNTMSTPVLLLLAMVMMGACLSKAIDTELLNEPDILSNTIGEALRWLIFQHRSPGASEPWELQSLLILEVFEKRHWHQGHDDQDEEDSNCPQQKK